MLWVLLAKVLLLSRALFGRLRSLSLLVIGVSIFHLTVLANILRRRDRQPLIAAHIHVLKLFLAALFVLEVFDLHLLEAVLKLSLLPSVVHTLQIAVCISLLGLLLTEVVWSLLDMVIGLSKVGLTPFILSH